MSSLADIPTSPHVYKRGRSGSMVYLNNSVACMPVTITPWSTECSSAAVANNAAIITSIKAIVARMCPMMENLEADNISISTLGGGLTNVLYLVTGTEKKADTKVSTTGRKTHV